MSAMEGGAKPLSAKKKEYFRTKLKCLECSEMEDYTKKYSDIFISVQTFKSLIAKLGNGKAAVMSASIVYYFEILLFIPFFGGRLP